METPNPSYEPSNERANEPAGPAAWALPDSGAGRDDRPPSGPPLQGEEPAGPASEPPALPAKPGLRLPVPLRPMTMSDLLDGAFAIIKTRPGPVFGVTAAIIIPIHLIQAWLSRNLVSGSSFSVLLDQPTTRARTSTSQQGVDVLSAYIGIAIGTLAVFFVGCALAKLVSSWYAGGDATASEALRATWKATPAVLAVWALTLIPLAASNAVEVGWFFVDPLVIVVAPILVIEKVGPLQAIRRSLSLVSRRYFPVTGANALATLMAVIATQVLTLLPQLLAAALHAPWDWIVLGVGQSLASLLLTPAVAGVAVLIYLDLRVRSEGLDIELQAAESFASAA